MNISRRPKWFINHLYRKYYNIVNKHAKVCFLHVPKTGGTYIGQLDSTAKPVIYPINYLGHSVVVNNPLDITDEFPPSGGYKKSNFILKESLKNKTVITVVRNPFDWLVSYVGFAAGWNDKFMNKSHVDFDICSKGFDYAAKTILNRDTIWPSQRFLHFQLFSSDGDFIPDYILRNESLDSDLNDLSTKFNLKYVQRTKQKVGNRRDYREYYDDALIDLVNTRWGRDLDLFGYDFDGVLHNKITNRELSSLEKSSITYRYSQDDLIFSDNR